MKEDPMYRRWTYTPNWVWGILFLVLCLLILWGSVPTLQSSRVSPAAEPAKIAAEPAKPSRGQASRTTHREPADPPRASGGDGGSDGASEPAPGIQEALAVTSQVFDALTGFPIEVFAARLKRLGDSATKPLDEMNLDEATRWTRYAHADHTLDFGIGDPHAQGRVVLRTAAGGIYVLDVQAPGYVTHRHGPFELRAGANYACRCDLEREAIVRGVILGRTVSGATGPVARALVEICVKRRSGGRGTVMTTRADDRGKFELHRVPPGTYFVRADDEIMAPAESQPFDVRSQDIFDGLRLTMGRRGGLRGKILGLTLPADAHVIVSGGAERIFTAPVDARGRYEITGLPPGDYVAQAGVGSAAAMLRNFKQDMNRGAADAHLPNSFVPEGRTIEHDIPLSLATPVEVFGTVTRAVGGPADCVVEIVEKIPAGDKRHPRKYLAQLDAHHAYSCAAVLPGSYEFRVRPSGVKGIWHTQDLFVSVRPRKQRVDVRFTR